MQIPTGLTLQNSAPSKRVLRRPQHTFHLRTRPYQIQPFMLAPVLAGETLNNLLLQARVVTDPIKNPFIGWHVEYYFFYVKLRDLDAREIMEDMLLDMTADTSSLNDGTADVKYYHHSGKNYAKLALKRITEEYFRDEGETWNTAAIDNLPLAKVNQKHWTESVYAASELPDDEIPEPAEDFSDFEGKWNTWNYMRSMKMTEMSFEDYMGTFGVQTSKTEPHKPELLRYVKEWSYPSNTIDPASGAPSSAVSWSIAERGDKTRFFKEPGFIVGLSVVRPKVYLGGQRESGSHLLDGAFEWLPAIMKDRVETSLKTLAGGTGPLGGVHTTNPYIVDVRDLFVHGDQFLNFALTETDAGLVALPKTTHVASAYPSSADINALFVGEAPANQVRQDGVVSASILGTQLDHT